MAKTILDSTVTPTRLTISGELTFGSVNDLHASLLDACNASDELVISLDGVSSIDAAGLQLLFAVCRYVDAHAKKLSIETGAAAERLNRILEFAGLTPPGCMQGSTEE